MTAQSIFVLFVTLLAATLLISETLRPDLVALLILVVLGLSGVVQPNMVFSGFGGSAVMTLLGISIISEALRQTGVSSWLGRLMLRWGKKDEKRLILAVMLTSAALSLFMNNIAAVGVLLPAVMALARRSQVSPSRLLMPLAFGTSLGGMATLLTTSNIIVSGALKDAGFKPFGLLDFFPIGAPLLVIGVVYMLVVGRKLLPSAQIQDSNKPRQSGLPLADLYGLGQKLNEIRVLSTSELIHKTIAAGCWSEQTGLSIIGIKRQKRTLLAPSSTEKILPEDRILAIGDLPAQQLMDKLGLQSIETPVENFSIANQETALAEVILAPHSNIVGRCLRDIHFRERFHLNVLGIWRESKPIITALSDTPLHFGDALLVQGSAEAIHLLKDYPDLILMDEDPDAVLRPRKTGLALTLTLITLGVAALGYLPVAVVAMAGAVLLLLTGCLNMNDVYHSIEWKAIFLIAGMWPLSDAIRSTGLASGIMNGLLGWLGPLSGLGIAAILLFFALIFTQLMSGQVAALVLAPLAMAAAQGAGLDPRSLGIAVALGCSLSFPTPFGHPVNIMVMSPGGYKIKDFFRVGFPLTLLIMGAILIGLHFLWGL